MTKLNKVLILTGVLLLTGGILLMAFPHIMKYVFSVISVLAGIVFLAIAWKGRKAG